ncbi:histidine kinase [Ramlibacter tataouinensis]|uniref:sensor histidine kinase n=1 Tax=Ramlibacter tataouinensis TaxID=94132 RepID=UPI0022F406FF|nr:ATP-binding protein [Ramlibacter tataouinensis]WBY03638.1 histidine kinase [Ramlibacter tataouinensis]
MGRWWRRIVAVSAVLVLGVVQPAAAQEQVLREAVFRIAGDPGPGRPVALPHAWETTVPGYAGVASYAVAITPPPGQGPLALYVERACSNLQVWLGGELVGGDAALEPQAHRCYQPHLVVLPRALLRGERTELRLDVPGRAAPGVVSRQRAAGLSELRIGPLDLLQARYERQRFWTVTVARLVSALLGALGLGLLGLSLLRRQGGRLLYFGLYASGWALLEVRLFAPIPGPSPLDDILLYSLMGPTFCSAFIFLLRMVERRWPRVERALWVQCAVVPALLWAASPAHLLPAFAAFYNLMALEFLVFAGFFFRTAWRERREDFWVMAVAIGAIAAMVGLEIALQNRWLPFHGLHLTHFMVPVTAAMIGLHLMRQFARALRATEQANIELERRVAEKSREIEQTWRQLAQLRAAEAAQGERRRIASDLHDDLGARLLGITQASANAGGGLDGERIASLARQALDEMRLAVRGMTAEPARAADVFADWRAECVARLQAAGLQVHWAAAEPPAGQALPSRVQVQCTRVLREAISNVIRHSGATECRVRIALQDGGLLLEVGDNGRGLQLPPAGTAGRGHGLASIEGRVRGLAGWHRFDTGPGGGTRLAAWLPLETPSANIDAI